MRDVDGVPSLQREDFDAAAATNQGQVFTIQCGACGARLMFVDYLPKRRVLGLRCGSCASVACSPIIPESAGAAGGEIPIVSTAPPPGGVQ